MTVTFLVQNQFFQNILSGLPSECQTVLQSDLVLSLFGWQTSVKNILTSPINCFMSSYSKMYSFHLIHNIINLSKII